MRHPSDKLEAAIEQVFASYQGPEEINSLESAALPNRRAIINAFNHLAPALYIGFYSTRSLTAHNLRHTISEHLYPAYEILVEQIHRALSYEHNQRVLGSNSLEEFSEKAVLGLFNQLPQLRRLLNGDVVATFEGDPAARSIEEVVFSSPGVRALTAHRVAHVLYRQGVPMVPRIISEYAHSQTGIDIHAGAQIGHRFCIDHGTGLVVGETTVIGSNVKVYQGVTLGALSITRPCDDPVPSEGNGAFCPHPKKRHPTIEDDVTIYTGAKILGGETVIGAGSVIGGNVWLVHSVPPGTKLFGREREDKPMSPEQIAAENGRTHGA